MALLFADEGFSRKIVEALRSLGHDVLTVADIQMAHQGWPDEDVFRFAIEYDRAVLTTNRRHFFRLHREMPQHPGIIACTEDPDHAGCAQRIHEALTSTKELRGNVIRIYKSPRP